MEWELGQGGVRIGCGDIQLGAKGTQRVKGVTCNWPRGPLLTSRKSIDKNKESPQCDLFNFPRPAAIWESERDFPTLLPPPPPTA